jgi:hypothetical protein
MSRKLWLAFVMIHNISPEVTKWPFMVLLKSSSSYTYLAMVLPKFPPLWRLIWTLEPPGLKARLEDCLATGQLVDSGKGVTAPLPSNGPNGSLGRQEEQLQVKRKHKGSMAVMDSTCQVECLSDRDLPDSPRSCV